MALLVGCTDDGVSGNTSPAEQSLTPAQAARAARTIESDVGSTTSDAGFVLDLAAGAEWVFRSRIMVDSSGVPLPSGATARLGTVRLHHRGGARALACDPSPPVTPDASSAAAIVAIAGDDTLRSWNGSTGAQTAPPLALAAGARAVLMLPVSSDADGATSARVVIGYESGLVEARAFAGGKVLATLETTLGPISQLEQSGDAVVIIGRSKTVLVWSPQATEAPLPLSLEHSARVLTAVVGADGAIATLTNDGTVSLWSPGLEQPRTLVSGIERASAPRMAFVDGGKRLAVYAISVHVLDAQTGDELLAIDGGAPGPDQAIIALPGSTRLVTSHADGLRAWSAEGGQPLDLLTLPGSPVTAMTLCSGRSIAVAQDDVIRLFDATSFAPTITSPGHQAAVTALNISADGAHLASASLDNTVRIWVGTEQRAALQHTHAVTDVAFAPTGARLATASPFAGVFLWTLAGEAVSIRLSDAPARQVAFTPDGERVVVGAADGQLLIIEVHGGAVVAQAKASGPVHRMALSPLGDHLAVILDSGALETWTIADGLSLEGAVELTEGLVVGVAYASSDLLVSVRHATEAASTLVGFHTVGLDLSPRDLVLNDMVGTSLAVSPDGGIALVGGQDGRLAVVEVATRRDRFRMDGHEGPTTALAFSPDGLRAASASADSTILMWDFAPLRVYVAPTTTQTPPPPPPPTPAPPPPLADSARDTAP